MRGGIPTDGLCQIGGHQKHLQRPPRLGTYENSNPIAPPPKKKIDKKRKSRMKENWAGGEE